MYVVRKIVIVGRGTESKERILSTLLLLSGHMASAVLCEMKLLLSAV
jgi:hypothetical protein